MVWRLLIFCSYIGSEFLHIRNEEILVIGIIVGEKEC